MRTRGSAAEAIPAGIGDRRARRLVIVAWVVYASFYVGRVNLAVTIPGLESERGYSGLQIGTLATAFFWTYALAGIPSGHIADRFGVRRVVAAGLIGSAAMNAWFAVSDTFWVALVVWSINGVFQSMGWPAILSSVSSWASPRRRQRTVAAFGSCFVVGSIVALGVGGVVVESVGTDALFTLSAVCLATMALLWVTAVRSSDDHASTVLAVVPHHVRIWWLLPATVATGATYLTILLWTPAYFVDQQGLSVGAAGLMSAILPLSAIVAIPIVGRIVREAPIERVVRTCAGLMAGAMIVVVLPLATSLVASAVVLCVANGLAGAASSLVLGLFPSVVAASRPGLVVGVFALAFNLGGGLVSPLVGHLADTHAWAVTFFGLALLLLMATAWTLGVAAHITRSRGGRQLAAEQ